MRPDTTTKLQIPTLREQTLLTWLPHLSSTPISAEQKQIFAVNEKNTKKPIVKPDRQFKVLVSVRQLDTVLTLYTKYM